MQETIKRYLKAKKALFDIYYSDLNENQRKSVYCVNNPLLILAGAGSGKTTVLVRRIAHIVKFGNAYYNDLVPYEVNEMHLTALERSVALPKEELENILSEFAFEQCPPWRILAITFTNKAANEIKERLAKQFPDEETARDIWTGTFHSICMRILRSHHEKIGYRAGFCVYSTDDTKSAMQKCMKELDFDEKIMPVKSVINAISKAKEKLQTPEMYEAEAGNNPKYQSIAKVYKLYQKSLLQSNALDFDDIIMQTVRLFRENKDVLKSYSDKFKYVCVDEYQDTNKAQFYLTEMLASSHRNLMVVGDDDQSIYKFRGATIENILQFDKNFSDATVIKLEQNYRSTKNILCAANEIINNNKERHPKMLWTENDMGSKIHIKQALNQTDEAKYIVNTIQKAVAENKYKYRDFAVLYRTNAQSNSLEATFVKSGVAYRILGGTRFSDRKEIRDVVAYLQLINNHDDKERLLRIINEPSRKIGAKTISVISEIAVEENKSMFEIIENADSYMALKNSSVRLLEFSALINYLTAYLNEHLLNELVEEMLIKSGYRQMLTDAGEEEKDRLLNIEEFVSGIMQYQSENEEPTLTGFLEQNSLVADVDRYDESADAVVMMTIHSSKGLEFPCVFLPGFEESIFPSEQSSHSDSELEEERRLAYVATTRAKKELFIIYAKDRLLFGRILCNKPSRFIEEIPNELKEEVPTENNMPRATTAKTYYSQKTISFSDLTINKQLFTKPQGVVERFSVGDHVSHITFGSGEIITVTTMGQDVLYEVIFDKVGTKKLMGNYAKLTKI